jgi:amino acid adenylation domain-containing protein/non-ribosomal peptide synthase protein (TIGR01720 family)
VIDAMKNVADIYPLSPTQLGMLFHTIQAPHSGVYFQQFICTLTGELDRTAFTHAWQRIVEAHAVLRTAFIWEEIDEPVQVVRQQVEIPFRYENWQHLSAPAQQTHLASILRTDRQRGFNLAKAPLMRFLLGKIAPDKHQFIWSSHHILLDGWSVQGLLRSVFRLYESIRQDAKAKIKPTPPYRDYIAWLQGQDLALAEDFWRKKLSGFTAPTPLTIDTERRNRSSAEADYHQRKGKIDVQVTNRIKALAKSQRLTLNTIIQGTWAIVLSRYSGESEVVFGATVSGRPPDLPGVEKIVGLFINTLPVRLTVSTDEELMPWLMEIQQQSLAMQQYEYTPLANIQGCSELPRARSLFDSIVVFENYPTDGGSFLPENSSLVLSNIQYLEQSNYPLSFLAVPGESLELYLIYDRRYFEDKAIDRLMGHLETILGSLALQPEQTLGAIPILTSAEETQIFDVWNDTRSDLPNDVCIHELIEHQAQNQPDQLAVIGIDKNYTYREIDRHANQLARYLRQLGVGTDTNVGLCVERSADMILGILGILKAGGAYLPLDPTYPRKRLAFMLEDAGATVIVTQQGHTERLPAENHIKPVCLDTQWDQIAKHNNQPIPTSADGRHLAYVIYTSGSTGQPKGVPITHKNLVHSTLARLDYYPVPLQRFLLLSSFAFDSSIVGIFWSLCQGGTLVLPQERLEQDISGLAELIHSQAISHTLCLPTLYNLLLRHAKSDLLASLQTVIVAGEVCPQELAQTHYRRLPHTHLYNEYGPTEGTVWSTVYEFPPKFNGIQAPIGKPIANTQAFILDAQLRPVPIGVTGELYISGHGLTQGYLNRPDLTAECFIDHTFENGVDARLYRTGDLARYLPDGNIVFLERADHQVKIRGYRIEMTEIETCLQAHSAIQDAAVMARTVTKDRASDVIDPEKRIRPARRLQEKRSATQNMQLVAYIVVRDGRFAPEGQTLRHFLREYLPDYMVPNRFIPLDKLPRTPNGKLDRRALPNPDEDWDVVVADAVPPRNRIEAKLAEIWQAVLGLDAIGIHDNFFEIGGDSILSIRIMAKVSQAGLKLAPNQIFQHQTIAELAHVVGTNSSPHAEQTEVTGNVPLTPIQHWFFEQALADPQQWNQAFMLEVPAEVNAQSLEKAIHYLIRHHDALRLQFDHTAAGWQQQIADIQKDVRLKTVDLSALSADAQKVAIQSHARRLYASSELGQAPLFKACLFRLKWDRPNRLLLVAHHLVIDMISWQILLDDLETAYQQLSQGNPVKLPAKKTSFKQWAETLIQVAQSKHNQATLSYWLNGDTQTIKKLPVKVSKKGKNTGAPAQTVTVKLTVEETQHFLYDIAAAYNTEANDLLLAALTAALGRWIGPGRILIGLEGNARKAVARKLDVSRTIGWFTAFYPIILPIAAVANYGDHIKAIKEQLRRVPNRGLDYGIARYLGGESTIIAQLNRYQPDILFKYLGQFDQMTGRNGQFKVLSTHLGRARSGDNEQSHLLDINAFLTKRQLTVTWTYSPHYHDSETITQVASDFIEALRAIIHHCLAPDAGGYTPSDFPEANLDQKALDDLMDEFSEVTD